MKKIIKISFFCLIIAISGFAQVSINTDNSTPDPSSMLDIKSINQGLLIPRMTSAQRAAIASPAEGLIVFCTNCGAGGWGELSFYTYGSWHSLVPQNQWSCGNSLTINHVVGAVSPVTKTVTYGTVTNVPGETTKCWITSNLGADRQATALNDATEASGGWYWQFNLKQGYKHDGTSRTPNSPWITSISENSDWVASKDPCTIELGYAWRIPTYTEWYNVDNTGGWTNSNGPWNSVLKIHPAGFLLGSDASLNWRGSSGIYWSSTGYTLTHAYVLTYNPSFCNMAYDSKTYGFSVRCIREQ